MSELVPIAVAKGDGIGPEIMDATLRILQAAGARIKPEFITVGLEAYEAGEKTGISKESWEILRRTKILLKAPLTTPQGAGYKSVNVTLRKALGLFANVRPTQTFEPYVHSKHAGVDMVIVRENEEDLYAGIEYRQTRDSCQSVKLLSRSGSERIIRYAFEYARANNRKKVTCLIKDNIMKITDGMFHYSFKLIAKEYPEIEADSMIVDIGMAQVAAQPERFDVLVTLNLYGDIVSDIASQVSGSVGLAGSFNLGEKFAMFEAVHGSAPDIAGKGIANPSGLLNGAILMLNHIGQNDVAAKIQNAWMRAIEDGCHTGDIAQNTNLALSTSDFADAVVERLGQEPLRLRPVTAEGKKETLMPTHDQRTITIREKKNVGVDVFVAADNTTARTIGKLAETCAPEGLKFELVSSRGAKVYPIEESAEMLIVNDLWRLRFYGENVTHEQKRQLLINLEDKGFDWVQVQGLHTFDGERGYSLCQGE